MHGDAGHVIEMQMAASLQGPVRVAEGTPIESKRRGQTSYANVPDILAGEGLGLCKVLREPRSEYKT